MFDHIMLRTQQPDVMTAFYEKALAPLGIKKLMAFESGAGFGRDKPGLWISKSGEPRSSVHLALTSPNQSAVRAFHAAALAAGAKDNGAPGPRDFAPNYYAAFVIDPDGNNIEAASRGV
jgi:catechol 2,3-dioxygenase-like lactoylglutathione lyase family enzyme